MVEIFNDDKFYNDRFREMYNPEFMQSPIDYYLLHKVRPKVLRYCVGIYPVLNGCYIDHAPLLFEKGDHLDIKFFMQRHGPVGFNQYMQFLHEAYKTRQLNSAGEYSGSWSFQI